MREINAKSNSSVDKVFELLDKLASGGKTLSAGEISEALGVTKATTYSLLRSCLDSGYVERDPHSGRFALGYKFYEYGMAYRYRFPFLAVAGMHIQRTSAQLCVRCVVYVHRGGRAIQILIVDNSPLPDMNWGYSFPVWACASGRMLLSALSEEALTQELQGERIPLSPSSVTDETELRDLIAKAKEQGYCIEHGEINPERTCISAPIYDYSGEMLATVCFQISPQRWQEDGDLLTDEACHLAARISLDLGYKAIG